MYCSNCGTQTEAPAAFCPNCGNGLDASAAASHGGQTATVNPSWQTAGGVGSSSAVGFPPQVEEKGRRVIAYLIDIVPMLVLALVHFLPIIGWMLYGLLHALYWLFRDYTGASLGKIALGAYVTSEEGGPSTPAQRVIRNIPLAIPGLIGMIPLIGLPFEALFALVIFGGEALALLLTGRRIGDRIAGTNVYRKGVNL